MKLYHGTDDISAKSIYKAQTVDVNIGSDKVDFGKGFYMTDDIDKAVAWAYRKAKVRKRKPALVTIYFDEESARPYITSFNDDLRWGQFVINNRNGIKYFNQVSKGEHNLDAKYHITYGRIADINVVDIAEMLEKEGKELEDLSDILNTNYPFQYVLHTKFSTKFISKITYRNLKEVKP